MLTRAPLKDPNCTLREGSNLLIKSASCDRMSFFVHCRTIEKQFTIFGLFEQLLQLYKWSKIALLDVADGVQCSLIL